MESVLAFAAAFFAGGGGAPVFGALLAVGDGVGCSSIRVPRSASVGIEVARASTTEMRKSGGPGADLRKFGEGRWTLKWVVNGVVDEGPDIGGVDVVLLGFDGSEVSVLLGCHANMI